MFIFSMMDVGKVTEMLQPNEVLLLQSAASADVVILHNGNT